ncbi:HemK2/MTQ2 family protein methyltransferase [Streptomyces sp. TRM70308]|uniref:HemK2/MTQ2 family protein methyltransferase n=1 Tax=Streptomyces sp. TRM70308 TaxID=3131932 RepID=UPI003D037C5A
MLLLRPPGVYAPQADSWLLRQALADAALAPGARVLDLCTGTGVLGLAALRMGAGEVLAVDSARRAVLTARCNAWLRRLPLSVRRGDLERAVAGRRFDVVLANPPYVPSPGPHRAAPGTPAGSWNGGVDGRTVLDRLCDRAPELLVRGGTLLVVHSEVSRPELTLDRLRAGGLKASVVARAHVPFGPVMRREAAWLRARGLIEPGQTREELVVVRGDRP